jgi:molybdenum cofactor cytidylyltransferase
MPARPDVGHRLTAVVMAAGFGTRFGGGKLLAPYDGGFLLDHALAAAADAPVADIVLVTGADAEHIETAARAWLERRGGPVGMSVVHAPDHRDGLSASLKAGIRAVHTRRDGAFVFLGDMPRIPPGLPARLAEALVPGVMAAVPVHAGQRGHPALIRRDLFPKIMALTGDRGAGRILDELGPLLVGVPTENSGVLFDVDRPVDLDSRRAASDIE